MRIVCDNCAAKYQISDDKVRNKVFKIRCKKCSHTIVVRSKGDAPAASGESVEDATRVALAPPGDPGGSVESAGPDAIWYVVVNREQVGPMTSAEVERRFKAGDVDADCFTWAEGMADWIRLAAVTEFSHLFPQPKAPVRAAAPVAAAVAAPVGGGMFPKEEGDDDVMVSNNEPQTSGGADRLFGGGDDEPEAANPRVDAGPRLRSQRNENSVLFSLDSLSSAAEGPRVSNTGGAEGSGLIDISAMLGGSPSPSSGNEAFGGGIGLAPTSPAPLAGGPLPSLVNRKKSNTGLIIGMVAGAVIIAGGVVAAVVLSKDKASETPAAPAVVAAGDPKQAGAPASQAAAQPASVAAAVPPSGAAPATAAAPVSVASNDGLNPAARPAGGAPAPRPAGGGGPRVAAAGGHTAAQDDDAPKPGAATPARPAVADTPPPPPPKPAKKGGEDVDDLLGALDGKGSKPAGGGNRPAPAAAAEDPMLPESLTKQQILGVVKRATGSVASCKERQPDASGTVFIQMTIDKSGKVGKAAAKAPFAGTPVGNCVESVVRGFQFPQFSGDPMSFAMPFAL